MDCIKAYAPRNDGGEGGAMMVGRGGMVESGVSLRTNVKQSRMGNGGEWCVIAKECEAI